MGNYEFIHNQAISFHCISCEEIFKYKKTLTKKDKEQYEKQFKQSGTPESLPTTQEAYNKIKNKVSYIVGKYESTESELEDSKQNKKDINEYKADEYEGEIEMDRFWRPLTFYLYGPRESGKSGLWDGYIGQEVVLLDEFYTKIDFNEIINLLNDTSYCKTTYNFGKRHDDKELVQRDFGQFERKLDYIIEFKGKYDYNIDKRTTEIIFHKGDKNKFRNMCWYIEYCIGKDGIEKTIEKSKKFNQDIEGEHMVNGDNLYWRKKFPKFKKNYLRDYSKSKKIFHYKQEFLDNTFQNNIETENLTCKISTFQNNIIETEDLVYELSSSSSKKKLEEYNIKQKNKKNKG
ncbi:hypothetical protein C2G38_2217681 [Gigaspora rosea]|uniref:Uncharacterized protein n=1 Tax=Gigaspora rosea TaxID=44941 RepID=A0A397U7F9_9GLOM|nr:hypothetical protein C2G38_2217681 [Gigaspora rosea]